MGEVIISHGAWEMDFTLELLKDMVLKLNLDDQAELLSFLEDHIGNSEAKS